VRSRTHVERDYTSSLNADALKGARIGVARKVYFGYSDATDRLMDRAIADLKAQGATIIDPADIPTASKLDACENEVLRYEFKADVKKYLAARGASVRVHSLEDLIAFNEREKDREMPYFGRSCFIQSQKKGPSVHPRTAPRSASAGRSRASRDRPGHAAAQSRRAHRADGIASLDDRSGEW
jgi:amidase